MCCFYPYNRTSDNRFGQKMNNRVQYEPPALHAATIAPSYVYSLRDVSTSAFWLHKTLWRHNLHQKRLRQKIAPRNHPSDQFHFLFLIVQFGCWKGIWRFLEALLSKATILAKESHLRHGQFLQTLNVSITSSANSIDYFSDTNISVSLVSIKHNAQKLCLWKPSTTPQWKQYITMSNHNI